MAIEIRALQVFTPTGSVNANLRYQIQGDPHSIPADVLEAAILGYFLPEVSLGLEGGGYWAPGLASAVAS
jgi:hypothetical protein